MTGASMVHKLFRLDAVISIWGTNRQVLRAEW
jgi:hypothetical protein